MIKSLYSTGYEIQIDTLFTASDLGYNIIEYPINFINRRNGSSKMRKSDIINYIYSSMKRKFSK